MRYLNVNKAVARLILLQRIDLSNYKLKKLRKVFGRYLFTNFISKYFISKSEINLKYYREMNMEHEVLSKYLNFDDKKILSIGPGMCGLEIIINSKSQNSFFTIIEKNYVSKKIVYGWDVKNKEGYNNFNLLIDFLSNNEMKNNFEIYNYDEDDLPNEKFDYVISLYSLDYHYDFSFYSEYLKKVSTEKTKIIFDTVRPNYFKNLFNYVEEMPSIKKDIHASKRIICNQFIK